METIEIIKDRKQLMFNAPVIFISELQSQNSIYMSIKMRMCSTRPNLNDTSVTEAFIDDIVANKDKYIGVPLCADVNKLTRGDYRGLGHMYDTKSGVFHTQQIGSFCNFEKVEDEYGISLIGEARVAKRNEKVCAALVEIYESGNLNFSYEIEAAEVSVVDGIMIIDASENNTLVGMAVVSIPAYPEAKALALVAELDVERARQRMFVHANVYMSEVALDTIYGWVFNAVYETLGEAAFNLSAERICLDCVILYDAKTAQTFKMEYIVGDEGLTIVDFYEVAFERKREGGTLGRDYEKEDVNNMEDNKRDNENIAEVTVETAVEENVEIAESKAETKEEVIMLTDSIVISSEEAEEHTIKAEHETVNLADEVTRLQAEIAELLEYKKRYEEAEAAKETERIEKRKSELRAFAQKKGLNLEDEKIISAIDALDSEALLAELMKLEEKEAEAQSAVNPVVSEIKIKGNKYSLLEPDTSK